MNPAQAPTHFPQPFSPSPEVTSQLLEDLVDPDTSLRALARRYETTLDVLTQFLAREDIAEQVRLIESTYAAKARLVATAHLPAVAHLLTRIVDEHQDEANHIPIKPGSLPALEQRRRSRETARRAATLLLRIAKFQAGPSPTPPRGTGVPPVLSSRRRDLFPQSPTALPGPLPEAGGVPHRLPLVSTDFTTAPDAAASNSPPTAPTIKIETTPAVEPHPFVGPPHPTRPPDTGASSPRNRRRLAAQHHTSDAARATYDASPPDPEPPAPTLTSLSAARPNLG